MHNSGDVSGDGVSGSGKDLWALGWWMSIIAIMIMMDQGEQWWWWWCD